MMLRNSTLLSTHSTNTEPLKITIMCLYEKVLKNPKYTENKKNKGIAPTCKDYRLSTINTACGWCSECRKKLSNDWRIRLTEELRRNEHCEFVTLSFSPEAINKLETEMYLKEYRGIRTNDGELETDVNLLAGYAIRMWSERWRKKHKRTPKHWLITELGHKNTERIHLHGLIWGTKTDIEKTWQYGNIYCGQWVDYRTINYIMKYVTKIDEIHKGYKQKIFCSKGIGKNYIQKYKKQHQFKGEKTITYYKNNKGYKIGLPRYYKEKLWTEEEREKIRLMQLDKNTIKLGKEEIKKDKITPKEFDNKLKSVREYDKKIGFGDNRTGNKKYIITEAMKQTNEELNNKKTQYVKFVPLRKIDKIEPYEKEDTNISKSKMKDEIYYGKYIGNTTEAQRNYNELLDEAKSKNISVRKLRLIKEGIIVDNFVDKLQQKK